MTAPRTFHTFTGVKPTTASGPELPICFMSGMVLRLFRQPLVGFTDGKQGIQ